MGLQLRLTHSLGDRLIDVEARLADRPIVVGRAGNAEVQVPSANIAKTHCLLFVHEGQWVVQDAGGPSGTYLNGLPITEPAYLHSGDVITLGDSVQPPTIVVDPHSVGVTEEAEEIGGSVTGRGSGRQHAAPPQQQMGRPAMAMPPQPSYGAPPQRGGIVDDEGGGEDDNIFGA